MADDREAPDPKAAPVIRLRAKKRELSDAHRAHLRSSGLTDESIDAGGFFTERPSAELAAILGWRSWPKLMGDGLVIPFFMPDAAGEGAEPFFARVRPDKPRENERTKKTAKYEQPKNTAIAPYFPVRSRVHRRYGDVAVPLVFTEGEKKAALLDQLGYAAIGATGVSCFHDAAHRKETDEFRLHALIARHVLIAGRVCFIAFDSDQVDNDNVLRAGRVLAGMLLAAGAASVRNVLIPTPEGAGKRGIDDFFAGEGEPATRALFTSAETLEGLTGNESVDTVVSHRVLEGIPLDPKLRMPHGYEISRDGALWFDNGSKNEPVERAAIFVSRLVADLYTSHELVELVFKRDKKWRTVTVPRRVMVDSRALVAELGAHGAPVDTNTASDVVKWLRDFEATNERRLPRALSVSSCGWHTVHEGTPREEDVFVLGAELLTREGSTVELVVDRPRDLVRLSRGLRTAGTYDAQLEHLRRAWAASPTCAAIIAAALAAPILKMLSAPIFGVHLAGDSSRGKSSMVKIGASVYGNPRDEEWVSSWNSTSVGHEQRAAHLCDLPMPIDESGIVEQRDRDRAVYMIMNGTGRTRGAKEGGLRETVSWRTVMLSTGEARLAGEDSASGVQVRVLQLPVSGFGSLDANAVDELRRGCEENYGHIGREWIEALLETPRSQREVERDAWTAIGRAFKDRVAGDNTMRGRQATSSWATLAYAEARAHDVLGLGEKGGATIARFFATPSDAHIELNSAADRAIGLVQHWIASEPSSFPALVHTSGGKAPKVEGNPREIHGYVDTDGTLLLLPQALKRYLGAAHIDDGVALREWRATGKLGGTEEGRFTTVVRIGGARQRLVALSADSVGLEGVTTVTTSDDFGAS